MKKMTKTVRLHYPNIDCERTENEPTEIEIELDHVRAADAIRISYDFDRDGYVIKQASIFAWEANDKECDGDWQEVAFIQAWGREDKSKNPLRTEDD